MAQLTNNIIENCKIANRPKRSKTNYENQQMLMMALFQHQKLINASFLKMILLSSCQKTMFQSFFKYFMFYTVFIISFPNILFVLQSFNIKFWNNIQFSNNKSFLVLRIDHIWSFQFNSMQSYFGKWIETEFSSNSQPNYLMNFPLNFIWIHTMHWCRI